MISRTQRMGTNKTLLVTVLCVITFMISAPSHAETYAVKIKEYGIADFTVMFKEYGIADEVWKVKGACSTSIGATSIIAKEYGIADLTVMIKTYGIADKDICIANPDDLPDWFREMLE